MFFKTYQKLLGASCLALYLAGCGNGESPIEMSVNSEGAFQIDSKADSVTIQGVKLNRGNCAVNFVLGDPVTPISIQDFKDEARVYKDMASIYEMLGDNQKERLANIENKISQLEQKGVMMEPQTLKFGESLKGTSRGCNIIEAEIQTNKGTWTFNFNR
ncbi:hypothetical protein [Helicobacter pylori]|uniref:Lipoprotein n=1 Tax=Helicobacter pylori GAM120Ai TaxID=1159029 RepID=A0AAV3IDM8_HELPX|nr:hypothetical protein [Helicobacter pylori]EJC14888.1 hypothetical protein HPHPP25_0038 [Helicobacter pylori Hp P-25]EJB90987.1 hypothetical protein HPHPH19_0044 [Helicobacter pylori Hp H-19]EJC32727.1 hypothetical protein HPHPP25C_1599 [Helicobacter pylori Hp P-25c]EJC38364.1 hypothetical protein HPHPP25D_0035 [Helicobacter pylori Hp P-25d]EMG88708.1 hypothetical protein HMPREF1397_00718 [Helicobacter pylori GAM115Ai]